MAQFIKIKNNIIATDEIINIVQIEHLVIVNFKQDGSYVYFEQENEKDAETLLDSIAYALEAGRA